MRVTLRGREKSRDDAEKEDRRFFVTLLCNLVGNMNRVKKTRRTKLTAKRSDQKKETRISWKEKRGRERQREGG